MDEMKRIEGDVPKPMTGRSPWTLPWKGTYMLDAGGEGRKRLCWGNCGTVDACPGMVMRRK